jgi:hypothetical protein
VCSVVCCVMWCAVCVCGVSDEDCGLDVGRDVMLGVVVCVDDVVRMRGRGCCVAVCLRQLV